MQSILYNFCLASIISPIIFYHLPYINTNIIKQSTFIKVCHFRMIIMFFSFLFYNYFYYERIFSIYSIANIFGFFCLMIGQIFNLGVYYKLGEKGVYYGLQYKTIKPKKIENEFPFCINHPLYFGGCLSYLGIMFMTMWKTEKLDSSILFLGYHAEMTQFFLILMENYFDGIYIS